LPTPTGSILAAGALPPSNAPWLVEVGGWIAFAAVAIWLLYRWRTNGKPDTAALLFIGCFTMWWQEFYADWGAYLYYNPDLALLPWGQTSFTTPNKPLYVVAGYGWFYAGGFALILSFFRWFRGRYPSAPYLLVLIFTALIPFFLWNLITADGVSFLTNWYQYLHPVGPAVETSKGGLPLFYPAFPFVLFAPLVVFTLDRRSDDGRTWFERLLGVKPTATGWVQRAHQIVAWIFGMNLMYSVCLTIPLVLIRILFLPDNPWVPS
jgi:hypothetical protein